MPDVPAAARPPAPAPVGDAARALQGELTPEAIDALMRGPVETCRPSDLKRPRGL